METNFSFSLQLHAALIEKLSLLSVIFCFFLPVLLFFQLSQLGTL